ncbi:MAG: hypothetical protein ACRESO_08185 [Gammaproteobacteria bacterium]
MTKTDRDVHPLVGSAVMKTSLPAKSDLSDWLDLMEVVEALCPKWPARPPEKYREFRL